MAKYDAVSTYLQRVPTEKLAIEVSLREFDRLCGGLPRSAWQQRTWWANGSNSQTQAWHRAGWHVDGVDFNTGVVRFARGKVGGSYAARRAEGRTEARPRRSPAVAPEGAVGGFVELSVKLEWRERGHVASPSGPLDFPALPSSPGLYRFQLRGGERQDTHVYIGETQDLRQRMRNYRRPPARAQTSVRINELLLTHLDGGGTVDLATCERATVALCDDERAIDLRLKRERVLAEHAALVVEAETGVATIANL